LVVVVLVVMLMHLVVLTVPIPYLAPSLQLAAVWEEMALLLLLKMVDQEAGEVDFLRTPAGQGTLLAHHQAKAIMVEMETPLVGVVVEVVLLLLVLMLLVETPEMVEMELRHQYLVLV
jgi:hypothetical protein